MNPNHQLAALSKPDRAFSIKPYRKLALYEIIY